MKSNNFWGSSRSSGVQVSMIVRLSLALMAMAGSVALAWVLLGGHYAAHASGVNTIGTNGHPGGVVIDSSGNVWVAEPNCNPSPTCVNPPTGAIEEFNLTGGLPHLVHTYQPVANSKINPTFLQLDGSGHVWFTDPTNNDLGELTTSTNTWTTFTTGISANAQPYGLVIDKNHNLWFAERGFASGATSAIGFFNTNTHAVKETSTGVTAGSNPFGLTYDAANNVVWFTEDSATKIGSFPVPSVGSAPTITEHSTAVGANPPNPHMITYDGNGHLWYSEQGSDLVGEYTVAGGTAKNYNLSNSICGLPTPCTNTFISGIALDKNGMVWFDEVQGSLLGSLNPTTSAVSIFNLPGSSGPGEGLAADGTANVWVSMLYGNKLGELPAGTAATPTPTTGSGSPSPTPLPNLPPGPVFKTWYFAEGHIGRSFQEYLTVANPDTVNACAVSFQYLLSSGPQTPKIVNVGPNTRLTENVDQDLSVQRNGTFAEDVSTIVSVDNTTTPKCTGVVAERPMYFNNVFGVNSGHDALGATHLGTSFYFADVASSPTYRDFITILNPGTSAANVTATYYQGGTVKGTDTVSVPAGARGTISPKNCGCTSGVHVSALVTSTQPVDIELPSYFSNFQAGNAGTVSGAAVVVGAQQPSNDWRFAEGYIGGKFQEDMLLSNFSTTAITANMVLEYDSGTTLTVPVTIGAQDTAKEDVNFITAHASSIPGAICSTPCTLTSSISAEITGASGSNFVAERQLFFQYSHNANGRMLNANGGTDIIGQPGAATATSYSFSEGYTNVGYDEWLTLQNPTGSNETIYVTIVNGSGHSFSFPVSVVKKSRATVDMVKTVLANLCTPGAPSQCWEISMTVQTVNNGGAFVAERPMYFNASGSQGGTAVLGYIGG